jgi:hypothetical protein
MAVVVTGDKHAEIEMHNLQRRNRPMPLAKDDKLIIAGDFGLVLPEMPTKEEKHWATWYKIRKGWVRWLNEQKWTTLFVDGNHENFDVLEQVPEETMWGGKVGRVSDKIYHLKRGEIYNIEGHSILTFGGAQSIDKYRRQEFVSWWKQEIPSHQEFSYCLDNIAAHGNKVDYVITHTCPREISEMMEGNYGFGKLEDPTSKMLSHINSTIEFKQWLFGHWHVNAQFGKYRCLWHDFALLD